MIDHPIKIGAVYSALSSQELLFKVLPLFDIPTPISCDLWYQGANDSYKVITESDKYLLRIYRKGWRTKSNIEFELDVLNHLQKEGVNVGYPIPATNGEKIVSIDTPEGERFAVVTSFAEGKKMSCNISANAELFGKSVANIHTHSEGFTASHDRFKLDLVHLIEEPLKKIEPYLKNRDSDWEFLKSYAAMLTEKITSTQSELLDIGFCHGDPHSGNAHELNGELTFFDFDCCGMGYRAYDLAIYRWSAIRANKDQERWLPFISAYQEARPLSGKDLELIDYFISIRHIWFMGFHIDTVLTEGFFSEQYFTHSLKFLRALHDAKKALEESKS